MKSIFIVAFAGISSPELIKHLASITHKNGGKWLVSKIHYLDTHISGILKVEIPSENKQIIQDYFLDQDELVVTFSDVLSHRNQHSHNKLKVDSEDRPGIINDINHILKHQGIELIDMDSHRISVPANGSSVFTATLTITLPPSTNIHNIAAEIDALSDDMVVTVI